MVRYYLGRGQDKMIRLEDSVVINFGTDGLGFGRFKEVVGQSVTYFVYDLAASDTPGLAPLVKIGISNHCWIVDWKVCFVTNKFGLICGFEVLTTNVYDAKSRPLIERFKDEMIVFVDSSFYLKDGKNPKNMKVCRRGKWNERVVIETVNVPKRGGQILSAPTTWIFTAELASTDSDHNCGFSEGTHEMHLKKTGRFHLPLRIPKFTKVSGNGGT